MTSDVNEVSTAMTNAQLLRILVVEDGDRDADVIHRELCRAQIMFTSRVVRCREDYLRQLDAFEPDLILSDYAMPQFTGMDALELRKEFCPDIPFIIVTRGINEETAVECMQAGADDYVTTGHLARLGQAVRRALEQKRLRDQQAECERTREQAEEALRHREAYLCRIWENVEVGIMLVDADTREIVDLNPVAAALVGAPCGEIVGKQCHAVVCPAARDKCPILDLGQCVDRAERQLRRIDGTTVPIAKSVAPLRVGGRDLLLESFVDITELKEAEEKLRFTQFVTDHAGDAVYWTGSDARLLYVNETACRALGYTRDELLGMTVHDIDPNFPAEVWPQHWRQLQERGSMVIESTHRARDGHEFPVEISLSYQALGGEERNCAFARDITERKQAQSKLEEQERYFRSLMHGIHEDIMVIDRDYVITDVNNFLVRTLGRPRDEVIGRHCYEVCHGRSEPCAGRLDTCGLREVSRTGEPSNCRHIHIRSDGSEVHVDIVFSPMKDAAGSVTHVVGAMRDVTKLMEAHERLRKSETRHRALFESSRDAIMTLEPPTWRFTSGNPATVDVFRARDEDAFTSRAPWEFSPVWQPDGRRSEEKAKEMIETAMCEGHHFFEWRHKRLDGEEFPATVLLTRIELGDQTFLQATVRDETERLSLEAQVRQSQKLESIGTLAGGVAHEINNPINGIMNYAQLIKDVLGAQNETVAEYAGEIILETERIATLVKNLLQFARHDRQSHSPALVADIVEASSSLVRTVMRHDRITFAVEVPEDLPRIKCRSQQIQQVMMNLLTNARDALSEKYPGYDENKLIRVTAEQFSRNQREWIRVTVEDRGPGIPDNVRESIFDPFYTTKDRTLGTGLGLSISHGIVKDHGGELTVECEPGEWTKFHVDLPVDTGWEVGETAR